jgi:hypothetical protein
MVLWSVASPDTIKMPVLKSALSGKLRLWLILGVIAGLSTPSSAGSGSYRVNVNPARCGSLSATQQEWLTAEWRPYLDYTRICPVRNPKRETVLWLVSVHADLYYRAQPGASATIIKLPSPLLLRSSGEVLGSLPYNFPDDPPAQLRVTFVVWESDFPRKVELFLTDPRASGDRSLPPLLWDDSKKKYASTEDPPHGR